MSSWLNRDKKTHAKRNFKSLGKPFRKVISKDSKQDRDWAKQRRKLRRQADQDSEDTE